TVAVRQCAVTDSYVSYTLEASRQREGTEGRVERSRINERCPVIENKRVGSNGRVVKARDVEQQRCSTNCGIGIRVVDGERSTAYTGVEIAGAIAKERPPTKSRISGAGAIANERTITLKRAEVAAATIYTLSLRYR